MLKQTILIDSKKDKIFGNYANFKARLPFYMRGIKKFDILGISIDSSQYLINENNNLFTFCKRTNNTVKSTVIELDCGDYNYETLANAIMTEVNKDADVNLKITFDDEKTLKYTMTADVDFAFKCSKGLASILGFNTETDFGNKLTSARIVKFTKTNYYIVEIFGKRTIYFNNVSNDGIYINDDIRTFILENSISTDMIDIKILDMHEQVPNFQLPVQIGLVLYYEK
jgi:hypothetical protein